MAKIEHIYDPIFKQNYYFINCKTHKKYREIVKKELQLEIEEKKYPTDGGFQLIEKQGNPIALFWGDKNKPEIIAHECLHAISEVMRDKQIPLTYDTEEVYCYLLQWLMREIL